MSVPPSPGARRARAAALLAAVFAAGALAGAAVDRALVPRPTIRTRIGTSTGGVLDSLGLAPEQRRRVDAALERGRPRIEAAMRDVLPRLRAVSDSIDAEVRAILTAEQRARLDALRARGAGGTPRLILKQQTKGPESTVTRAETLLTTPLRP
jgi:Spy/CpxP family protein refolding chaperone